MKSLFAALAAALLAMPLPAAASTNPDTPTAMRSNVIIGAMHKEGTYAPQYFGFRAGPGKVKLRLTIRPNDDGASVYAAIDDTDGNELVKIGDGTSNNKDSIKSAAIDVPAQKDLVLVINGNAMFYGKHHPTFRVQLDGDVQLNKTAKPMKI